MKKFRFVILAVVIVVAAIVLLNVYNNHRTYTVGRNPKLSEITRVYVMSSMYSSDYGYIYDQYSAGVRNGEYYAETDLYDKDRGEQVKTTVSISEDEYGEILEFIDGSKYARKKASDPNRMDGYMDDLNQSADIIWDHLPDGPYGLSLSSEARSGFINAVETATSSN